MSFIDDELNDEDSGAWIATFADMITLLLVFFILLYSLSEIDVGRFKQAIASIQNTLRGDMAVQLGLTEFVPPAPPEIIIKQPTPKTEDEKKEIETHEAKQKSDEAIVYDDIKAFIKNNQLDSEVGVKLAGKTLVIRVKNRGLFPPGSAHLSTQKARRTFNEIFNLFLRYPSYNINIKGHTDNIPIKTVQFPSNWELSAIRATSVLRYFISKGIEAERLTATGYADILPLVPNNNATNRALNRRVEFVLEKAF